MSDCYCCKTSSKQLPSGVGIAGTPLAACKRCGSFSCGCHGHRDASVPEFVCVLCDPSLLTSSALQLDDSSAAPSIITTIGIRTVWRYPEFPFDSLEDFIARRPLYGAKLHRSMRNARIDFSKAANDLVANQLREIENIEARKLLAAAGVIVKYIYRGGYPDDLPSALKFLARNLQENQEGTL